MSATTDSPAEVGAAAPAEHPFRNLEEGWQRVPRSALRTNRTKKQVQTRLEVVLDPERSAWVLQQAARAGVDFESYVNALIDAARDVERAQGAARG